MAQERFPDPPIQSHLQSPRVGSVPYPIPQATQAERLRHLTEQEGYITLDRYDLRAYPLIPQYEAHWRRTLWATALREPDGSEIEAAFETILRLSFVTSLTETEQRILEMTLQVAYQFYGRSDRWRDRLQPLFQDMVKWSPNPRWVAMALSALANPTMNETVENRTVDNVDRQTWLDGVNARLPDLMQWGDENDRLLLDLTLRDLQDVQVQALQTQDQPVPPLEDWLQWQIAPGEPQLFVFCGPDRSQLCRTLLKDAQGHWVYEDHPSSGSDSQKPALWSVPLSGRSLHGLPWYLSRGETPQGIYRLAGFIPQPDTDFFYAYGFFPLVNLYVPHEVGVDSFVPGQSGTIDSLAAYQNLLPPRWRSVWGVQGSYWAGKLGRGLFRIHGTGEATDFFVNNDRFPQMEGWNPAIGCLSAREVYDSQGNFQEGDMPKIVEALERAAPPDQPPDQPSDQPKMVTGYVIVLNVPDPEAIDPHPNPSP